MKNYLVILISIIAACTIGVYIYFTYYNFYETGEDDTITCAVGETFKIRLYENGSTGYINHWLNENESEIIKKINIEYVPSIKARLGYKGAGGIKILTFEAVAAGRDTIKIAECFFVDKENINYVSEKHPADNMFIIDIGE